MMSTLAKISIGVLLVVVALAGAFSWFYYLEPRPADTTAARVYTEDPYAVDYCDLAVLDGSGLTADDIPKAYTPDCEVNRWPAPILAGCTEPLPAGADDLRGLWRAESGQVGHIERIEQCGNRLIVAGPRFIHDFRTTGRLADGANDISPRRCTRVRAAIEWNDEKTLEFRAWGVFKVVTRRLQDADTMIWEYPDEATSTLKRVCRLPPPNARVARDRWSESRASPELAGLADRESSQLQAPV